MVYAVAMKPHAVLAACSLMVAALILWSVLQPKPRVPTMTRISLSRVSAPWQTEKTEKETKKAPVYPTTSSIQPLISGKLNLNSATLEQLEALPDVGPVLAKRLLEGKPYRSLADLDRVKGVGKSTLEKLAPLVTF